MRHVIVLEDGERLVIEPSPTFRNVRVWMPGTQRVIAVPLEHVGSFCLAVQACADDVVAADRLTGAEG